MLRVTKWPVVWAAVWAALLLVASGEPADPPIIVGELSVAQLKEFISQAVAEALPLHNNCTDHPDANDCDAVVENGLCTRQDFYARFCCRSCTLARQIPTYGPHLRHKAKAPLTSVIVSDRSENISCLVSGFPPPHVVWFREGVDVRSLGLYEQKAEDLGGVLVKKLRSDLIVRNATGNDTTYSCMAINDEGFVSSLVYIRDELRVKILPEVPFFRPNEPATLECIATGRYVNRTTWMLYTFPRVSFLGNEDRYNITETRTTTDGITTVNSAITFLTSAEDNQRCFECVVEGLNYRETNKCVTITDTSPLCEDTIASSICYEEQYKCSKDDYFFRFCCRTCTKILNPSNNVSVPDLEIVQGRAMLTADDDVIFECISRIAEVSNVTWTIDDQDIEDSEMYRIEESESLVDGVSTVGSKLSVLQQKVEHNGKVLSCGVKHRGTIMLTAVKVTTSYPPKVSVTAEQTNPYGKETRLQCMALGYPDLNITWFRDGKRIEESSSYRILEPSEPSKCRPVECKTMSILVIRKVTGDLLGRYVCRATNAVDTNEKGGTLVLKKTGITDWIGN